MIAKDKKNFRKQVGRWRSQQSNKNKAQSEENNEKHPSF